MLSYMCVMSFNACQVVDTDVSRMHASTTFRDLLKSKGKLTAGMSAGCVCSDSSRTSGA